MTPEPSFGVPPNRVNASPQIRALRSISIPSEDALPIQADAEALRRALLILMDNAAKYTPRGGSVHVSVERQNGFAIASVTDTGIGIDPEDLDLVFDRFWRADKARSRQQGGAGLGLSIAKWMIDVPGGGISVQSEPGKGSQFTVRLPLQANSAPGFERSSAPARKNGTHGGRQQSRKRAMAAPVVRAPVSQRPFLGGTRHM